MILFLYELLATFVSPFVVLLVLVHPRLRAHATERLGGPTLLVPPGALWLHAASLGEGRVVAALCGPLRDVAPGVPLLRTCTSDSARALVERPGVDQVVCLPVDLPWVVARWLDRVRPRALILAEAEIWPALLRACRRRGIPVVVVQARVASGQRRWLSWRPLFAAATAGVTFLCPDEQTAALLDGEVVGDLKSAAPPPTPALRWSRAAVIGGSTWEGEEAALVEAVRSLPSPPLLILAPRQPARFDAVAHWLGEQKLRVVRRSELGGAREAVVPDGVDVVLLDSLGELGGLYASAAAAFIGGTFRGDVGGHSPAEALASGCPVLRGPEISANEAAWRGVDAVVAESPAGLAEALLAAMARGRSEVSGGDAVRAVMAHFSRMGPDASPLWTAPVPAERTLRPLLLPLGWIWMLLVTLRPGRRDRAPIPVVAVGALTAGGAGKTPVAAEIAGWLAHLRPMVVARGYRRDRGGEVRLSAADPTPPAIPTPPASATTPVSANTGAAVLPASPGWRELPSAPPSAFHLHSAATLGDELAMLARRGLPVVSSPDRLAGVRAAANAGAGVAILDDALQHRQLHHDVEVVCIDTRWPLGGGPLPAGLRRAPLSRLGQADVVWCNHGPLPDELRRYLRPDTVVVVAEYRPVAVVRRGEILPLDVLFDPESARAAGVPIGRPIGAFAGIARPEGFFQLLRDAGLTPKDTWIWPDHHRFTWQDLQEIESWLDDHLVLTTEKDLARLPAGLGVIGVRVALQVLSGEAEIRDLLARRVTTSGPGRAEPDKNYG